MKSSIAAFLSIFLVSCGGNQDSLEEPVADEAAARYQTKVSDKVSDSMVNSFVREWGVTEDQARCVVSSIKTVELMRADTDPDVQAQLRKCGVDPAVVK